MLRAVQNLEKAKTVLEWGHPHQAQKILQEGLRDRRLPKNLCGLFHQALGESQAHRGRWRQALSHYQTSMTHLISDPPAWVESSLAVIGCHRVLGEFGRMEKWIQKTDAVIHKEKLHAYSSSLQLEKALLWRLKGKPKQCLRELRRLLLLCHNEKNRPKTAHVLWAIGGTHRALGDYPKAEQSFRDAAGLYRRLRDPHGYAYALCGMAGVLRLQGKPRACAQNYEKAGDLLKKSADEFGLAYSHCGCGNALRHLGRPGEALKRYQLSEKIYRRIGDQVDLAYVWWGMARAHQALAEEKKAERLYKKASTIFKRYGEKRGEKLCRIAVQTLHRSFSGKLPDQLEIFA